MVILSLGGMLCSYFLNASAKASCEQVDALIRFLRYVRNQVDFYALPASQILEDCDDELFIGFGLYNRPHGVSFEFLASECDIYDKESEKIAREFFSGFGGYYREEQVRECERCIAMLEERRAVLFGQLPKKKKINNTICIASALCLGILLI